jgi:HEAT repeat protein
MVGWVAIGLIMVGCASGPKRPKAMGTLPPPAKPPEVPTARNEPINQDLREAARREIRNASVSNDPILRANAIEAAQNGMPEEAHPIIAKGLSDQASIVRFAACMAAGTLQLKDLYAQIVPMARETNDKVRIAAIFALHRLGDSSHTHELEKTARDPNPRVRQDTAFVLGRLGEPSASKILRQMLVDPDTDVRLEVASSLWLMHDERGLELLVAGVVSKFADDQMTCLGAIVGPKDRRIENYVRGKLTDPYIEVALVAARAMGELGYDEGYSVATGALSNDPRQKMLAAMALGAIGRSDAQMRLQDLLSDADPKVRLAGAMALLQLKEPA